MKKNNKLSILTRGILLENPVFVLILGTCPTLATTTSVVSAITMGIAATLVLVCSNMVISALRKIIPDTVRIPCYIVVIATFVTVVQMLLNAFLPDLYSMLGVYLALIVVNCIILGRAEMFARENNVVDSALDGIGMGIGFTVALLAMALIREVIGTGAFAGISIPVIKDFAISILATPPGGFFVFGCLIALVNFIKKGKDQRMEFSCKGCPSQAICHKECLECEKEAK